MTSVRNISDKRKKRLFDKQDSPGEGVGVLLYKGDGGAHRKISRTPLKGTRILFYGRVQIHFHP